MRLSILLFLLFQLASSLTAQDRNSDSIQLQLREAKTDLERYKAYRGMYLFFEEVNRDSAIAYAYLTSQIAAKNNKILASNYALVHAAYQLNSVGEYADAFKILIKVLEVAKDPKYDKEESWPYPDGLVSSDPRSLLRSYTYHILAQLMWQTENNTKAIEYLLEAEKWGRKALSNQRVAMANTNLGRSFVYEKKYESAHVFCDSAFAAANRGKFYKYISSLYYVLADIAQQTGKPEQAEAYFRKGMAEGSKNKNLASVYYNDWALVKILIDQNRIPEALPLAMENLRYAQQLGPTYNRSIHLGTVYENIYRCYDKIGNKDSIVKYQALTLHAKDSVYSLRVRNLATFQNRILDEQLRLKNVEQEKIAYQSRIRNIALFGGLAFLSAIAIILYRNNRQKQKANLELESTLTELKATQSQLIQAEKMASLGELTAGIAHEIQNPLNFVNNFSQLNKELLNEFDAESDEAEKASLLVDVRQNMDKVIHHGKRAEQIVKGMLAHSRKTNGEKELTDLNALCDEFMKLSYHGFRSKNADFQAVLHTDLDPRLPLVKAVPQDIGRVLLNVLNNAFYAVYEKQQASIPDYEPRVSIRTYGKESTVMIEVEDNGMGIPEPIREKIFQPFFTTKPTGSGTGLGLSICYDIIKSHKGIIDVQSNGTTGTRFKIGLPVS